MLIALAPVPAFALCQTRPVLIVSAIGCAPCASAKAYLRSRGIVYDEDSVGTLAQAMSRGITTPIITAEGRTIEGFYPDWLNARLCVR